MSKPSQTSSVIAEYMLDVVPATMRMIRFELRRSAQSDVTVPQLRVMAHINRGVTTASELAELQGVSLAAISKMVDALVGRSLIERKFKPGNRKQIFLTFTDKGKKHYLKIRNLAKTKLSLEIKNCSQEERTSLFEGLKALERILKRHSPTAPKIEKELRL